MSLIDQYPKIHRARAAQLRTLLEGDPGLSARDREEIAMAINVLADKAHDLNEIFERLLDGKHDPAAIGELLIAFELTTEQIRGASDVIDGKLYEIGDRLKALRAADASGPGRSD